MNMHFNKYVKYLFCQKLVHLLTHLKNLIETLIIVLELLSSFADSLILSNCLGSTSNVFNAGGRLFWGYIVDRLPFKVKNLDHF